MPKPDKQIPVKELESVILRAMERAGTHPAYVYAFKKTGRLVTEASKNNLTAEEIAEWVAAVDEYEDQYE